MKPSILFIFITVTLDMIGIGLIIPSLPDIMRRFVSDPNLVSEYYGYFISLYALMQFLASPLLGAISDKVGRRPVLLVSLFIASLDYLVMAFAPSLLILFVGRIVSGLTGANITVAMAYIADVSTDENRSKNFGMIGAAFGLGFIIGPAIGGLLGDFGPQYPFIVAASLNLLNFVFGWLVLPESLPQNLRRSVNFGKINPLNSLKAVFKMPNLLALICVFFLFQLAGQTHPSIWTLYTQTRYGWTTFQVGMSLAVVGVLSVISQGWLTGVVVPKFGEKKVVLYGCLIFFIAFMMFGFATEGWMIYFILILSAPAGVAPPALQSLISKDVPANEQGELQGSLMSLSSLTAILNPIIATQLFAYFYNHPTFAIPGAPYFFGAAAALIAYLILLKNKIY